MRSGRRRVLPGLPRSLLNTCRVFLIFIGQPGEAVRVVVVEQRGRGRFILFVTATETRPTDGTKCRASFAYRSRRASFMLMPFCAFVSLDTWRKKERKTAARKLRNGTADAKCYGFHDRIHHAGVYCLISSLLRAKNDFQRLYLPPSRLRNLEECLIRVRLTALKFD